MFYYKVIIWNSGHRLHVSLTFSVKHYIKHSSLKAIAGFWKMVGCYRFSFLLSPISLSFSFAFSPHIFIALKTSKIILCSKSYKYRLWEVQLWTIWFIPSSESSAVPAPTRSVTFSAPFLPCTSHWIKMCIPLHFSLTLSVRFK